ncbi:ASCH domain-containing protein [Companilactobacillus musae]|uniref:ASCH domain-containing protein n=1 Tax=Companilactobacillus musae TaxID=1903258 RepID=UPI000E6480BB|nr:ASCH domain-containing protein [Companilactobacillus musae]
MDKEKIQDYWFNFLRDKNSLYYPLGDITIFGGEPQKLAELVYDGIKTATSSSYELYEPTEYMPQIGDYNIILDGDQEPVCITKTLVTEVIPFKQVSAEHAYHEGEGDRTLEYWRQVHEDFFKKEYAEAGKTFNEDIPVLCEVFERIY